MSLSLHQLREKIDARNLRERGLILLCIVAVLFLFWDLIVQSSIDNTQKSLTNKLSEVSSQRQALDQQIAAITLALTSDPNLEQKNRIRQLNNDIAEVEARLTGLARGLIAADDLPRILQEMLAQTSGLVLEQVQTLPVEELSLVARQNAGTAEQVTAGVFKHSVVLRVSGRYFELLEFLQRLETSSWRFYWEQLDYRVSDYPNADVLLRVYTLGTDRGLLGV